VSASNRWLAGVGIVVLVAVVVAAVVTVVADGEQSFPEGSPEATVQRYLRAIADRDAGTALNLLSPELREQCEGVGRDPITRRGESRISARLERTEPREDGAAADVHVRLTERYGGGPFDSGESVQLVVFHLRRFDGAWRFTDPPWPLFCPRPAPAR